MGLIRLRVRELAAEKGWTLKEVSERSGIPYGTVRSYAHSPNLATLDYKDPFDRLLIAQANVEDAVLVSCDPIVAQYPVKLAW